ncbi:MAG: FAD synthetase family protein [Bacteroidales bacterium]|nr:FAD synthetase family protein [Bacteroidales bacterium]
METYGSLDDFTHRTDSVVSLGMFDGLHLAHREVLRALTDRARATGSRSVVISFTPHPRALLSGKPFPLILTQDEKRLLLEEQHVDIWCRLPFTRELAATPPETLLEQLDSKLKINHIVLGYNHNFGAGKSGGIHTLNALRSRYGFGITEIPRMQSEGTEISSSAIRKALLAGDIRTASRLLGYSYFAHIQPVGKSDDGSLHARVPAEKLLPAPGNYDGHFNHSPVKITILNQQEMLLRSGDGTPLPELPRQLPLYWDSL